MFFHEFYVISNKNTVIYNKKLSFYLMSSSKVKNDFLISRSNGI